MIRFGKILGFLLIALCLAQAGPARAQNALATFERGELEIETGDGTPHLFQIELATAPEQQSQGLMFRRSLAPDAGMLFVYPSDRTITMWMRNTLIPLDMVFIAADGRIVKVAQRTVPMSLATISSGGPARAVLEVNGGTAARLGLKPGDQVVHPAFQ
jgi:uncharacterized membrane protein (UPF0127 family)